MQKLIKALETEERNAEAYAEEARKWGLEKEAAYWEGYQDAITNASALIYGPTPLDGEAN